MGLLNFTSLEKLIGKNFPIDNNHLLGKGHSFTTHIEKTKGPIGERLLYAL